MMKIILFYFMQGGYNHIQKKTNQMELGVLTVDGSQTVDEMADYVYKFFGL